MLLKLEFKTYQDNLLEVEDNCFTVAARDHVDLLIPELAILS